MAPKEVEVTISSAKDLKNVNWRHGELKPYAVVWVDPAAKCSTHVDESGDACPFWDEKLTIPLHGRSVEDSTLCIDIVHADAHEDTKPLIGSAKVPLREVLDDVGPNEKWSKSLTLKRPSGRPQGKLDVKIEVREPKYYAPPPGAYAPPYGQTTSRDYAPPPYAYGQPPAAPYSTAPPGGYPYNPPYGQPAYGYGQPAYGQEAYGAPVPEKKGSKYGMGTGLAVGAAAGLIGGLAIAEGVDYVEDKIADDAAEKVEDDLAYDGGDYGGDDF